MVLCLVACGGAPAATDLEGKYGIDLEAAGEQTLSSDRAAKSVLTETKDVWLEGKMTFALDPDAKTYEEVAEHIGCDASLYTYSADDMERQFVWISEEDPTAKFLAVFWETAQGWTLYSVGSTNLG